MAYRTLLEVLETRREDLLDEWVEAQRRNGGVRTDVLTDAELRRQSEAVLDLFVEAVETGRIEDLYGEGWSGIRAGLEGVARRREQRGFTPTETTAFMLSLREPLFSRLGKIGPGDPSALAEELASTARLLEQLALFTTERLLRSREDARRAVEVRERILSIVSHDLRNPIGAIQTGAQFLLERRDLGGELGRKQLEAILRSSERAHRLIEDLLDVSSIDQGELSVRTEPVEIELILSEVRDLMQSGVDQAGLRLEVVGDDEAPAVCADRDRVVQALGNLVGNAIRYTPQGGTIRVEVALRPPGDAVRFTVRDTGPGVPAEDRDHLFDRFWTRGSDSDGAGLGLAIVRGIVEGHGGRVWLDPEAGEGAVFHFTVPVADASCGE